MKIGVDLDDVLLDCNTSLARFHNSRYGTSYERKDVFSWHIELLWGCTREEAMVRVEHWYGSLEHSQSAPVHGAIEAVEVLSKVHDLHIVTSRPSQIRGLTEEWLERHFRERFSGVHFTNHSKPGSGSKGDMCGNLGVSLLIEDSPQHAQEAAAKGVTVLLLDCPWNQEKVSGNIIRIATWKDALDFIASK